MDNKIIKIGSKHSETLRFINASPDKEFTPTYIGLMVGDKRLPLAQEWGSRILRSLCSMNLISKNINGNYQAKSDIYENKP